RQLLARNSDRHVLHQGIEKRVEFTVHRLFGRDAQMDVHCRNGMGKRSNRDVVHSGFGELAYRFQRNATGGLQRNPSTDDLYGFASIGRTEIVEQNNVGACSQRDPELFQITNFDFDLYQMAKMSPGFSDGVGYGLMKNEVIVFDEHPVK